jgi:hypothetical protein
MKIGRTVQLAEAQSLEVVQYQLLHPKHYVGGFRGNGRNTPSSDTDEQDAKRRMSRTERDGTEVLEV